MASLAQRFFCGIARCAGAEPVERDEHRDRPAPSVSCACGLCGALRGREWTPGGDRRRWFVGGDRTMETALTIGAAQC